jgi:AraC-like DNA-binding protein
MKESQRCLVETFRCVGNGYKPADKHSWGPGVRDVYAIHYIVSGKGYFTLNQTCYELQRGESFLIFPGSEVYYYPDETDPWEYAWVEFRGEEAKELIALTAFTITSPVVAAIRSEDAGDWMKHYNIPEAYGRERYEIERAGAKMRMLLSNYIEHFPKNQLPATMEYVQAAKQFMEINYWKSELSVGDVVSYANIERSYLFRLFKENTGMSVHQYLTAYRIQKACELLSNTKLAVKTVACSVGYPDQLHFSKLFKKMTGIAPSQYQKEGNDQIKYNLTE